MHKILHWNATKLIFEICTNCDFLVFKFNCYFKYKLLELEWPAVNLCYNAVIFIWFLDYNIIQFKHANQLQFTKVPAFFWHEHYFNLWDECFKNASSVRRAPHSNPNRIFLTDNQNVNPPPPTAGYISTLTDDYKITTFLGIGNNNNTEDL